MTPTDGILTFRKEEFHTKLLALALAAGRRQQRAPQYVLNLEIISFSNYFGIQGGETLEYDCMLTLSEPSKAKCPLFIPRFAIFNAGYKRFCILASLYFHSSKIREQNSMQVPWEISASPSHPITSVAGINSIGPLPLKTATYVRSVTNHHQR